MGVYRYLMGVPWSQITPEEAQKNREYYNNMHNYMNGHTCPSCGKSGIICTIEDGFCENEGTCDDCIKAKFYKQESDGYDDDYNYEGWACAHGFFEGDECPICEHRDGQHDIEYVGEDWDGPEFPCPLCENPNLSPQEASKQLVVYMNNIGGS